MAKNYDDIGGVWRTIGGRRVFIKTGQSLSEAMIESGKFKNLRSDYRKAKEEEKKKEIDPVALDKKALELYEKDDDAGWGDFTDEELKELAKQCQITKENPFGRAYDDEVFEEMDKRGLSLGNDEIIGKDEYALYKKARENEDSIDPMTENSTDWEALDKKYRDKYEQEKAFGKGYLNEEDNKSIKQLNDEMLGDKYKGTGPTPNLVYSNGRRIDIANNVDGGKTATIWKDGKIERKTNLPDNVKGDKTKDYFDDYLSQLDGVDKKEGFTQKSTSPFYPDRDYTQEELKKMEDAGIRPTKNSYSGSGWEGVNSNKNLSTKEQAKAITDAMKKKYPDVKISRKSELYSGGSSIHLDIMSSDKDLYVTDADIDKMSLQDLGEITRSNGFNWWAKDNVPGYKENRAMYTDKDVKTYAKTRLEEMKKGDNQSVRGDEWYLSNYGKKVVTDLNKEANSYTYDDSDAMTDYFNHGTYMWINIGKYDKPYQVNQKATGETINNTLRQKAYQKYLKEHPSSKITFDDFKDMRK